MEGGGGGVFDTIAAKRTLQYRPQRICPFCAVCVCSDGGGVVVDGFPRTMVQALTIKLLFDQMKILRDIHINDPVLKNKFRCEAWGGGGQ